MQIELVEHAVEMLVHDHDPNAVAIYEPKDIEEANAAIRRLGELFAGLPGVFMRALESASESGSLLSGDRLQGLAEVVQNADDVGASQVRILLRPTDLLVSHNGAPVRLHNVLGFAIPWLSTKGDESTTTGRFGIGLMALRSLSTTIQVHAPPYHFQLGQPTISTLEPPALPPLCQEEGWTTLVVPLEQGALSKEDLDSWLQQWDDASLIFLRHVNQITSFSMESRPVRKLSVSRLNEGEVPVGEQGSSRAAIRQRVESSDGRAWYTYSVSYPSPPGVSRTRKATGEVTSISVGFPLQPIDGGMTYSGLPVSPTRTALFVDAQFDPLTSRRGFADTEWNRALIPSVAELWAHGALDLFQRHPRAGWHAMPATPAPDDPTDSWLVQSLETAISHRARTWLSSNLSFHVPGKGDIPLEHLAFETEPLENILTELEVAELAQLPATLSSNVRDPRGRWRDVLSDWRQHGAKLPEPVGVARAIALLKDESRPIESTIELAAAALAEGLDDSLLTLPCVVTRDGRRLVPPLGDSPESIAVRPIRLAEELGIATILHEAHLSESRAASTVLAWLKECGALLDDSEDRAILARLASAGRSGRSLATPLTDAQTIALRDAFERLDPTERQELGPFVGRAITLDAFTFDGRRRRTTSARPFEAYLPSTIDREPDSFAVAAGQAPGLVWLSTKYARILRSSFGRQGVGAQRFLRLLGAETAPRVKPHPGLERRFSDPRWGLKRSLQAGPESRHKAMEERGASYTLQDRHCPDLLSVVMDVSRERRKGRRRQRASALLATLSRSWERTFADLAEVDCASDHFQWQLKGQIPAFWVWQLGDIPWLDDESGNLRRPAELRMRTPGNVALHGDASPDFLRKDFSQFSFRAVLNAIGVSGDPSRSELLDRLRQLRDGTAEEGQQLAATDLRQEVAILYKALAHDLQASTSRSALTGAQLRREFQQGKGLVLTNLGWLPPRAVLGGHQVFGDYAAFALRVDGTEALWQALNLREPSPEDCVRVIQRIGRKANGPDADDHIVLLETLRVLASHVASGNSVAPRQLRRLALWTSKGWARGRPVYATNDAALADGLRDKVPIWLPGGELDQFRSLLAPLQIQELRMLDADVLAPESSEEHGPSTELFHRALALLEEDLARNDPELAASIRVPWQTARTFSVRVHHTLSLSLHLDAEEAHRDFTIESYAKTDIGRGVLFIRHPIVLPRADGAGRALASLFDGNPRRLAQAWGAACALAEEGIQPESIELASQRDEREEAQMEDAIAERLAAIQSRTTSRRVRAGRRDSARSSTGQPDEGNRAGTRTADLGPPRTLVDPESLYVLDPRGRIEVGAAANRHKATRKGLVEPSKAPRVPRSKTAIPGYSALDREEVGMDLVRMLLNTDFDEIVDLRAQRNVGADAVDGMKAFYELKVSAGAEPDQVTLTSAEVKRAMTTPNYFLIIVSGIEGVEARPKVKVLVDPLNQLQQAYNGSLTLSGVHNAKSLVYEFAPIDQGGPNEPAKP